MSTKDWFRHTSWTRGDERDFFARLARARKRNRPQYMRIQAVHLLETHERGNVRSALNLLDLCLNEYAPADSEIEELQQVRAWCLEELGQTQAAVDAYRTAVQAHENTPRTLTLAPLDFAYLVVRKHQVRLYAEAWDVLTRYVEPVELLFPDPQYRYCAACAIILQEAGQSEQAKDFATKALEAASRTDSGLSHHRDIGLAGNIDRGMELRLRQILSPVPLWLLRFLP